MKSTQTEMIATLVKESRLAKGFTQKELSELTNVSIRSIQRIENGEILPRSYTLKTIANALDTPFEVFTGPGQPQPTALTKQDAIKNNSSSRISRPQRIVLSIGICTIVLLMAFAYIFQSGSFPETTFELFVYWSMVLLFTTTILFFLWGTRK